mmetsp:Transcript_22755/g.42740  ORF Transcript_22755/g.42740 Transcript_22755/m.42740 type:complete len:105 (-) Transcript_22755:343-657(-)
MQLLAASFCSDDMPLLVVANKQGGTNDLSLDEVSSFLGLRKLKRAYTCIGTNEYDSTKFVWSLHWVLGRLKLDPYRSLGGNRGIPTWDTISRQTKQKGISSDIS